MTTKDTPNDKYMSVKIKGKSKPGKAVLQNVQTALEESTGFPKK